MFTKIKNRFGTPGSHELAPLTRIEAYTEHDTNELPFLPRAVRVTTGGTLNITDAEGNDVDGYPIEAGAWDPIRPSKIRTGGTANGVFIGD